MVHVSTFRSVLDDAIDLAIHDVEVTLCDESGNSMIAHGRDLLCAKFLGDETATDLFFVDNDVAWPKGWMFKLVDYPVDMVAGVYPQRIDPPNFSCRYINKPELWSDPETGLLEVAGVPAGFLRISRACLEKMVAAYPEKRFADKNAPTGFAWALFDNIHEGDAYFGEDYSFCERWRRIGGQVWVDPRLEMTHTGFKSFKGSFGDWLLSRPRAADSVKSEAA